MPLSDYADSVSEVTRYGVDYDVYVFESGVKCVIPCGEDDVPEDDVLLAGIVSMQRIGCMDEDLPGSYGYKTVRRHDPLWPKSGSSHVYHHPERDEYLKIPVEAKGGALQFFAMNGIARALAADSELRVVRFRALLKAPLTRSTAAFMEAAQGVSAREVTRNLGLHGDYDVADEFSRILRKRMGRLLAAEVPGWLQPLMNDNPHLHPSLGIGGGEQNVFFEEHTDPADAIDPHTAQITLIDQAHPKLFTLGYHAIARYFSPKQGNDDTVRLPDVSRQETSKG